MSLELLQGVERAEARAEEIRQNAQQEAREILKSIEEVCAAKKQAAQKEHRALLVSELEKARRAATEAIEAQARERAAERAALRETARQRLPQAADFIVERVVRDGDR